VNNVLHGMRKEAVMVPLKVPLQHLS